MRNYSVYFAIIFVIVLTLFVGCEKDKNSSEDPGKADKNTELLDSTVIRTSGTEVAALDVNNNGLVYQCPMDFEVISDFEGRCPKCKMFLEEYPVREAQSNFSGQ